MIDITTMSSMSVKPRAERNLPVTVLGAVERGALECRVDVEDVLAAPLRRVRLVLVGTKRPLGRPGHGIDGDAAEEFQLPAGRVVVRRDAVHEGIEIRGVA